jgi:hypothetical protein
LAGEKVTDVYHDEAWVGMTYQPEYVTITKDDLYAAISAIEIALKHGVKIPHAFQSEMLMQTRQIEGALERLKKARERIGK